jgi:Concanavalin A-like lectin/glucanases superfamily
MRRSMSVVTVGAVSVAAMLATSPVAAVGPTAPRQGLVLHYPMESLPGGTTVPDASGSSLNGQLVVGTGAATLVSSLHGYGQALKLTGKQHQYVAVPSSPLENVNKYTLSAWVRYTGVQNDKTLGRWEILEKADSYWMNLRTNRRVRVGGFYGGCQSSNWKYLDSTSTLPVNTWKNVVSTYDGTWLRVYIDGNAAGAMRVSGATCANTQPLAVGAKNQPLNGLLEAFWDGRLDDVRIYNRALTVAEVQQLATRP